MAAPASLQELARLHIEVLSKGTGGNTKFACKCCERSFTGSLTRQLAHLTGTSGSGVAGCKDPDFIQEHRDAVKLEVERLERLERTKSGAKASSSQLSASGMYESLVRFSFYRAVLLIHLFVQVLLMPPLQKGSNSQQLWRHWQIRKPLIWLLLSSSMAVDCPYTLSGKSDEGCTVSVSLTSANTVSCAGHLSSKPCVRLSATAM